MADPNKLELARMHTHFHNYYAPVKGFYRMH